MNSKTVNAECSLRTLKAQNVSSLWVLRPGAWKLVSDLAAPEKVRGPLYVWFVL